MTLYPFLLGGGGFNSVIATGGTLSTQTIGGKLYNVHTFTSNGNFTITSTGQYGTVDVFMWGGGGCGGQWIGGGANGGGGGGAAYASTTNLSINVETLSVCAGGGGGEFDSGAGNGINISGTNYLFGGRGGRPGPGGFSSWGGGGGAASGLIRGTTFLVVCLFTLSIISFLVVLNGSLFEYNTR